MSHEELKCVQVWTISIKQHNSFLLTHYYPVLSKEEIYKSKRFYHEKDRQCYLIRRIMIRLLLAQKLDCLAKDIQFREGENKKPALSLPEAAIHFNISHSGDYIAIALAKGPIGIDVEKINLGFQYQGIMDHYFTPEEQRFILSDKNEALSKFFLLWTRKEAYVKYTGEGLLGDLQELPKLINLPNDIGVSRKDDTFFRVQTKQLTNEYFMSLVCSAALSEIQYFEYEGFTPYFDSSFAFPGLGPLL